MVDKKKKSDAPKPKRKPKAKPEHPPVSRSRASVRRGR